MKRKLFKSILTASAVAMICACGDDANSSGASDQQPLSGLSSETSNPQNQQNPGLSSANTNPQNPTSSSTEPVADNPCNKLVLTSAAWLLNVGTEWLIYSDGSVTDFAGNNVGLYADGVINNVAGEPVMQNVDLTVLPICQPNATVDPKTGEVTVVSSSSVGGTNPTSSTGTTPVESSSSVNTNPDLDANGFPTIESYGEPSAAYTKDILSNGKTGWSSRYWDACKPHCSWLSSVDTTSEETYQAGGTVARNCNIHDVEVPAFTLGHAVQQYWMGYEGTNSACVNENAGGTYTCTDMAPIQVNENLSYGYVAAPGGQFGGGCGKCFHLQFNGGNHANDVKATHKALKGKHMIVMASNIGYDVEEGQYDMLVPGGGVGAFNALSMQIGVPASGLGANGGGFLTECQASLGWDNTVEAYQECVIKKCDEVFKDWPNLLRGCRWYAEWYMAADNPTYNWEEVECPQYLIDHYMTTFNTTKENRWRWKDDWSDYKKGDELETQDCLTDEYPQGCAP